MENKQIAIIGGGIAGLTFSICLPSQGYQCHIFEKQSEFKEVGAAISVFPNALRVFEQVGMLNQILACGGEITKVFLKTANGRILAKSQPRYALPSICIHRKELHAILLKNSPATLHAKHEAKSVKNLPSGKAEVEFENGQRKVFDAVIGADGIHSIVRHHVLGDGKPIFRGYNIWRGVVDTDFDLGYGSETYGQGRRVGIVPIREGRYGWWATINEDFLQDDQPEGTREKLRRLFGDWHDPIPELIANTKTILKNGICDRIPVRGWTKGSVSLLGDAAHPMTPNLGQGGCLAIEGAYLLARAIQKYGITPTAFTRYEALQFTRSKAITEDSLRIGRLGQTEKRLAIWLRNLVLKATPSSTAMKMLDKYFSYQVTNLKI